MKREWRSRIDYSTWRSLVNYTCGSIFFQTGEDYGQRCHEGDRTDAPEGIYAGYGNGNQDYMVIVQNGVVKSEKMQHNGILKRWSRKKHALHEAAIHEIEVRTGLTRKF